MRFIIKDLIKKLRVNNFGWSDKNNDDLEKEVILWLRSNLIDKNVSFYDSRYIKRTEKIYGVDMATSDPVPGQKVHKCIVFKCDELGKINFVANLIQEIEIIKERVFSINDPYGEEDWEN